MEVKKTLKKELTATVLKRSDETSASVQVERKYSHPKYGKIVKDHKRYLVHVPAEFTEVQANNVVIIEETTPISKNKSWQIKAIIK